MQILSNSWSIHISEYSKELYLHYYNTKVKCYLDFNLFSDSMIFKNLETASLPLIQHILNPESLQNYKV